jgi:hypothetical protein
MTYEEFIGKYLDHIEGRADAEERRPFTAEGADGEGLKGKNALD